MPTQSPRCWPCKRRPSGERAARSPAAGGAVPGSIAAAQWAQVRAEAPQVAAAIQRYLQRLGAFLAPGSVAAADNALRQFARWMITDAGLEMDIPHVVSGEEWLAARKDLLAREKEVTRAKDAG